MPGASIRKTFASTDGTVTVQTIYRAQPSVTVPFDVVRYAVSSGLTVADLRTVEGQLSKKIPAGTWLPDVIAAAWSRVLSLMGSWRRTRASHWAPTSRRAF